MGLKVLEDAILERGTVCPGNILKVDSFLNHQMDINLFHEFGKEFKRIYGERPINKVLTVEASGIGIAAIVADHFNVPVLFAKKSQSINLGNDDTYSVTAKSFTHGNTNNIIVNKKYLTPEDHVLIIDDFLARGEALDALTGLCELAGATVEGIGIIIEKQWQNGAQRIRDKGYRVESLAVIESMDGDTGTITFAK